MPREFFISLTQLHVGIEKPRKVTPNVIRLLTNFSLYQQDTRHILDRTNKQKTVFKDHWQL